MRGIGDFQKDQFDARETRREKILRLLAERGPAHLTEIRRHVEGGRTMMQNLLAAMAAEGLIDDRPRKGVIYYQIPNPDAQPSAPPPPKKDDPGYSVEVVRGDPTHRRIRFNDNRRDGRGWRAPVAGFGGHSSLERV